MTEPTPTTMRAALLTGRGGPDMLVVRDDVAVPTPASDEVLICVSACGVNNTDINTRVGWYSKSVTEATSGDGFAEARSDDATWGRSGLTFPRIQGCRSVWHGRGGRSRGRRFARGSPRDRRPLAS